MNKILDYICIEIFEEDGIEEYFVIDPDIENIKELLKIEPKIRTKNEEYKSYIFILQYPSENDLRFSSGQILTIKNNNIFHTASTEGGSSGSPIIRRCKDHYIIGLHYGGNCNKKYNLGKVFYSILNDIKKKEKNEIICIYNKQVEQINILHDYKHDFPEGEYKKLYLEGKNNISQKHIEIY